MHNVHIRKSPRYLADIVQPTSSRATRSGLRALSLSLSSETDSYTLYHTSAAHQGPDFQKILGKITSLA